MDAERLEQLRSAAREAFAAEPVRFAYLFGSRAAGRPRPSSDTDVAVYLDDSLSQDGRLAVSLRLSGRLARAARTDVDVVVLNDAPLPLLGSILRQRVVLYGADEPRRVEFESTTFRLYTDFEPRLTAMSEGYLAAVARGTG